MRSYIKGIRESRLIKKTVKEKKYYEYLDELPVLNFFKIKNGNYKYLWKNELDREKKHPIGLFLYTFQQMYYQFPRLDNEYLRDMATLADYQSKYIRTKNMRWKNEYNTLKKKIDNTKPVDLNIDDFTDYIEHTFSNPIGSIDITRVSTSKAFNNYYKAIAKNRKNANN